MSNSDIVWGAAEIGRVIGRNRRQVYHMVDRGLIKSVRQVGNLLSASRTALLAEFGSGAAQHPTRTPAAESAVPATP